LVNVNTTSVGEGPSSGQLHVFPNPASNQFTITLGSNNKNVEVNIFDITGKIIYSNVVIDTQQLVVNTGEFSEGIYIVQIQSAGFVETKKLVVKK